MLLLILIAENDTHMNPELEPRNDLEDPLAGTESRFSVPNSLSPRESLVCLYLARVPGARLVDIKNDLRLDMLTLYPVLESLTERGIVERRGELYVYSESSETNVSLDH